MKKTGGKKDTDCGNHEFSLVPLKSDLYYKTEINLSFCDARSHTKSRGKKKCVEKTSCLCCPFFNRDGSYATNTFILPDEKQNYMENQAKYKEEHELRINDGNHEKSEMLIPRPKTKQNHCNVCRGSYEDYKDHIKSESHKMNIRKSTFNRYIKDIEGKYNSINQGRNFYSKICPNVETTQNVSLDERELINLGAPTKKLKRDISFTPTICYSIPPTSMAQSDMQTFNTLPLIPQSINQQGSLSYIHSFGSQIPLVHQSQLFSIMQASMCQQAAYNSQISHPMFLGIPNIFFNEYQEGRGQQAFFNMTPSVNKD